MTPAQTALHHAARNEWDQAHEAVQSDDGPEAAWVHAHLHRVEGDLENARYWYNRAGKPIATNPLNEEREAITAALA